MSTASALDLEFIAKRQDSSDHSSDALDPHLEKSGEKVGLQDSDSRDCAPTFPDGGLRAWLVAFTAFLENLTICGFMLSWGVFQGYYEEHTLYDVAPSKIAWIGSLLTALLMMPAVGVGRLCDLGYERPIFLIGSLGLVGSSFLVAQCKVYWQFLLAQGILGGLSTGMCITPLLYILGHWFRKKLGMVIALFSLGGSVGGTAIPILVQHLIPRVGFSWTMRICGSCTLLFLTSAALTMKRRFPPNNRPGGMFNVRALRNPAFAIYCCTAFVAFMGLQIIYTFLAISAIQRGVSPDFSFYLVGILNACSGAGRIFTALVVDKTGAANIYAPFILVASLVTFLWPLARAEQHFITVATIYGFSSAGFHSTWLLTAHFPGDIEDVGRRAGMAMTFAAFGAMAGPPISGAINRAMGGYQGVGYFGGSLLLLSSMLSLTMRSYVLKGWRGRF